GLARVLLLGAGIVAFALVSAMKTKFHHYVLVALPPLAMASGVFLDEHARARSKAPLLLVASAAVTALVGRDVAGSPARFVQLFTYRYDRLWPSTSSFGV